MCHDCMIRPGMPSVAMDPDEFLILFIDSTTHFDSFNLDLFLFIRIRTRSTSLTHTESTCHLYPLRSTIMYRYVSFPF